VIRRSAFFRIAARLQFFEPYVYSIVHRCHALCGREDQLTLKFGDIRGEVGGDFGAVRELHKEKFVFGIACFQECYRGIASRCDLVLHAAADIENHADADGNIFRREVCNLLLDLVFPDLKVFLVEATNVTV